LISPFVGLGKSLRPDFFFVEGQLEFDHGNGILILLDVFDEELVDFMKFLEGWSDVDDLVLLEGNQLT
jgi:hypothetical protein